MHVHTAESSDCANVSAQKMIQLYQKNDYHGIVVTDHYYKRHSYGTKEGADRFLKGYLKAKELGEKIGLVVLLGMELRFCDHPNDYLVFGLEEDFFRKNLAMFQWNLSEFKQKAPHLRIYQAHPFRPNMTRAPISYIHGIEVFNGNVRHQSQNTIAKQYAQQNNLLTLSGSDFHEPEDIKGGGVYFPYPIQDNQQLIKALDTQQPLYKRE